MWPVIKSNSIVCDLPAMCIISVTSHHLRDGDRRGLWVVPYGSTPPIPHKLYVLLVLMLPICVAMIPVIASQIQDCVYNTTKLYCVSKKSRMNIEV